jgi:hypothetical protein
VLDGTRPSSATSASTTGSKPDYAEIRKSVNVQVGRVKIDLVPPYEIHAEESGDERTVAIIVRAEKAGGFPQGRYDPATNRYWQGYGPETASLRVEIDSRRCISYSPQRGGHNGIVSKGGDIPFGRLRGLILRRRNAAYIDQVSQGLV